MSNHSSNPWFNDRRIIFNGPRRLRESITQILTDINQQLMHENPELIAQLSEQLQRLNDALHGRPAAARPRMNALGPAAVQTINFPPSPALIGENRTLSDVGQTTESANVAVSAATHRRYTDGSIDRFSVSNSLRSDTNATVVVNIELDGQQTNQQSTTDDSATVTEGGATSDEAVSPGNTDHGESNSSTATAEASVRRDQNGNVTVVNRQGDTNPDWRNLSELSRNVDVQRVLKYACFFVPFLLILLFRAVFIYTKDIFTVIVLFTVFIYADGVMTSQVIAKNNANRLKVVGLSALLTVQLFIIYAILYSDDKCERLFIFSKPNTFLDEENKILRLPTVLWYVLVTDLAAKTLCMILKCQIILMPRSFLSFKKRPVCYQWVEYTTHMYRWCLPMLPWCYYLMTPAYPAAFRCVLTTLYISLKVLFVVSKVKSWWSCMKIVLRPTSFGQKPSHSDLQNSGPQCSICYCPFEIPVQLDCKHIFCEDCISTWLDKEKTCPICRARVSTENRTWRDGATSMAIQIC